MRTSILALSILALSSLNLGACSVTAGQSTVGQYVDDSTITTRVKARFAENQKVSAMRLGVETLNGEVLLTGFAISQEERALAGDLALSVSGVKSVRNDIVVRGAHQ
ncbi:MAG TPA: BON domain-containing protein [Aquabacterium sp.]|uniref:BON domain-containing protein n=1 Tax=Aquabacterium sp. TaxID=1872578 RepID=UPI002E34A5BE|nr:BON domain-containing protein [Aquabacterium sp.]HEX5357939.1 BON domain-containing protein [Aquabacterium sp.]